MASQRLKAAQEEMTAVLIRANAMEEKATVTAHRGRRRKSD